MSSSPIQTIQSAMRHSGRILPRGGGTKPALSAPHRDCEILDLGGLTGVLEYQPDEFTFTALAGTPVREVEALLAEHGQYLPFDPLWTDQGATLGGTVAANTAGPRRYRYGGVRDFLLGIKMVDSHGDEVRGGGKVVKNASGFDLPKLMVGSLGGLGILVELSFKVFPQPETCATLEVDRDSLDAALNTIQQAAASRLDPDALDFAPLGPGYRVWVRLAGLAEALPHRLERLSDLLGRPPAHVGAEEARLWHEARELAWVPDEYSVIRVGLTPGRVAALEAALASHPVLRRYSCGGQLVWLAASQPVVGILNDLLAGLGLGGVVLRGGTGSIRIGRPPSRPFYQRVKQALDPAGHFMEV